MSLAHIGYKPAPEAVEKTRQANIGRKHSASAIEKMREAWKKRRQRKQQHAHS